MSHKMHTVKIPYCRSKIFAGQGSYCLPGLQAQEAPSHVICAVAPGNSNAAVSAQKCIQEIRNIIYFSSGEKRNNFDL